MQERNLLLAELPYSHGPPWSSLQGRGTGGGEKGLFVLSPILSPSFTASPSDPPTPLRLSIPVILKLKTAIESWNKAHENFLTFLFRKIWSLIPSIPKGLIELIESLFLSHNRGNDRVTNLKNIWREIYRASTALIVWRHQYKMAAAKVRTLSIDRSVLKPRWLNLARLQINDFSP